MKITFPDGNVREYADGTTGMEIAQSISSGLARNALGCFVNDKKYDLSRKINEDATIRFVTFDDEEGKEIYWHSSAHLMAEAVAELYPGTKFGIGPSIENGFYYDMELPEGVKISSEDIPALEKKFKELAKRKSDYERMEISWDDAVDFFKKEGDPYKIELLDGLREEEITLYKQGNFVDLCRGAHVPNTGVFKAVKFYSIAGAYWRGDSDRQMLTRIYGITFPKQKMLEEWVEKREEAEKRDHRRLGKELGLFAFSQSVGQGLPLWLPKGAILREQLEKFLKSVQKKFGYDQVISPHIGDVNLYKTSGHFQKYAEDSYQTINTPYEGEEFMLKPMNCPHHCEIYKTKPRSYRDLPVRFAEFGTVYRYEQSGELHGLTRVRSFTQDDAHIFCTPDQLKDEFKKVIDIIFIIFDALNFENFTAQISLRDPDNNEKYIGSEENWEKAERAIIEACEEKGLNTITETGEAAFYGPKLDFMIKDALGRSWQLGTIQVDYNLPERFELEYIGADDNKHRPIMIHRAPFGSMERFVAVLIEHTAGNFPFWLAPEQISVLPIGGDQQEYAKELADRLEDLGFRVIYDGRAEKVNRKIAESEQAKIPFALIIGAKEMEAGTVSVREHTVGDIGKMDIDEAIKLFQELNVPGAKRKHD